MFGDDRVRGTREQMTLQVDLVRHRAGAGLDLGDSYQNFYEVLMISYKLKLWILLDFWIIIILFILMDFGLLLELIKVLNFSRFWEMIFH